MPHFVSIKLFKLESDAYQGCIQVNNMTKIIAYRS